RPWPQRHASLPYQQNQQREYPWWRVDEDGNDGPQVRLPGSSVSFRWLCRDDLAQRRHVAGEGAAPGGSGGHRGLRLLANEGFRHGDITCLRQRFDVSAEIAVGGTGEFLQPGEVKPLRIRQRDERRHDPQPQWLVDDVVELSHR